MDVTDVKIQLLSRKEGRLLAFCTITLDNCFVVRDLRVIEGERGPFVAMPSRKITAVCKKCQTKNYLTSKFCNECGTALPNKVETSADGRRKLFTDIAHPVNMDARQRIQTEIVRAYRLELERSKSPGYQAQDLDALYLDDNSFQREDSPHDEKTSVDSHLDMLHSRPENLAARRENPE